jgi:hypothetical protein
MARSDKYEIIAFMAWFTASVNGSWVQVFIGTLFFALSLFFEFKDKHDL